MAQRPAGIPAGRAPRAGLPYFTVTLHLAKVPLCE